MFLFYRLDLEFTNVLELNVTTFFLWSILSICDTLLMCDVISRPIQLHFLEMIRFDLFGLIFDTFI